MVQQRCDHVRMPRLDSLDQRRLPRYFRGVNSGPFRYQQFYERLRSAFCCCVQRSDTKPAGSTYVCPLSQEQLRYRLMA